MILEDEFMHWERLLASHMLYCTYLFFFIVVNFVIH